MVAPDGKRVVFLRTRTGTDRSTCLWHFDVETNTEQLLVDPALQHEELRALPPEERMRRERAREASGGIVRFSANRDVTRVAFDLAGRIYLVDLPSGEPAELPTDGAAVDPRVDPTGTSVAYIERGALHVVGTDGSRARVLLAPEHDAITYGLAEFVAAEEMGRQRGYWWSPDGTRLLVARVDVSRVRRWHISDPSNPEAPGVEVAYPAAGTDNAEVTLRIIGLVGSSVEVAWDRTRFEYVTTADWSEHGLVVVVQSRDQRTMQVLDVNAVTGETSLLREDRDACWVDIVEGVPARLSDGTLVWSVNTDGAKRLVVGGDAVTDPSLELRDVVDVDGARVVFRASRTPAEVMVYTWSRTEGVQALSPDDGTLAVWRARRAGGTTVLLRRGLDRAGVEVSIHRDGHAPGRIESHAEVPVITPTVHLVRLGRRKLPAAVLFPRGHEPGSGKLPVLLDPYGGPGFQRVTASSGAFLVSQWFADQGFAVLVADGRGTPGIGPEWERSVRGEIATPVLEDQVDALRGAAEQWPDFDLSRVAIRGWSFGGYLAALAVLRRPDVFHVAIAGAPATDWRLYDTHYTERYLGHPDEEPDNYDRTSLIRDAPRLTRPLMLIHGLSDDNVVVAHSLRFSAALLAAGRQHTLLPLTGATHMANDETVAENLLLLELKFITRAFS